MNEQTKDRIALLKIVRDGLRKKTYINKDFHITNLSRLNYINKQIKKIEQL